MLFLIAAFTSTPYEAIKRPQTTVVIRTVGQQFPSTNQIDLIHLNDLTYNNGPRNGLHTESSTSEIKPELRRSDSATTIYENWPLKKWECRNF